MKDDVRPAALPGLEIPGLEFPSWAPAVIAQSLRARYAAEVDQAYRAARSGLGYFKHDVSDDVARAEAAGFLRDIVARWRPLVADRRMERVWRELSRRRRNGAPLHRARPPLSQGDAMLVLFDTALALQGQRGATTTWRQVEQQRNFYLAKAAELRGIAMAMPQLSWRDNVLERFEKLEVAALVFEAYAGEILATSFPTALQRRHDGRGRWVVLPLGEACHTLFGSPMYGVTATIASVILGREIEPRTVRQWLGHRAAKAQKITP